MKIVELASLGRAVAEMGGTRYDVDISLIDDPALGDHVIVHAGFAIEKLDIEEAEARLSLFEEISRQEPQAARPKKAEG